MLKDTTKPKTYADLNMGYPITPNNAYFGTRFLGKSKGEKALQVRLAHELLITHGISNNTPITYLDCGCGDGWFSINISTNGMIHPESQGHLFDTSEDMTCFSEENTKEIANLTVSGSREELFANLSDKNKADVVFLNMVDLCQPDRISLEDLFRSAAEHLKPRGLLLVTTQNPLARPGSFAHYQTKFRNSSQNVLSENAPILTRVEGVEGELLDFHRPLHATLGAMRYEDLMPLEIMTMDDQGQSRNCTLSDLVPENNTDNNCEIWVPTITRSAQFLICCLDKRGQVKETDVPSKGLISLNQKAPYMGIAAIKMAIPS